jgi:hypothetical protein
VCVCVRVRVLIVCNLETSKRGDSRPKLGCSATGNKKKGRKKINIHKSCNEPFGKSATQRVNTLVTDTAEVMNDQLMDRMIMV